MISIKKNGKRKISTETDTIDECLIQNWSYLVAEHW